MNKLKRRSFLGGGLASLGLPFVLGAQAPLAARIHTSPKAEPVLQELEKTLARYYNVPRKDGEFLNLLVKMAQAKSVLEIGTANGYSAIWLSLALEQTSGKLTTMEINPELVTAAKRNLRQAGLAERVTFLEGDAHELVREVEGPFDLVFIDAEIGGKMDYFGKLYPKKIKRGGLLVCHNVITYRSGMADFLEFMEQHNDFDSVILSLTMQDGFLVSWRHSGE